LKLSISIEIIILYSKAISKEVNHVFTTLYSGVVLANGSIEWNYEGDSDMLDYSEGFKSNFD